MIGRGHTDDRGVRTVGTAREQAERTDLWRRHRDCGDEHARERLILAYAPLVKYIAARMASRLPAHVDEGDLISSGLFGLISAIERFDPAHKIKFETFAAARIRGAIVDALRSLDWVPRSVRKKAREIRNVNAELERRLGRAPADAETAAALGVSVDELQASLVDISNSSMVALDESWAPSHGGDRTSLLDTIADANAVNPVGELDTCELRDRLTDAIVRLPERERLVVALYYYENLELSEIGEVLGVTESRASQLGTKAILRLRSALRDERVLLVGSG